ncbi:hypothetical protein [Clostridium sp. UBA7503]|uniref:pilus assembly FimT family protein n=1 Tax=Clostridium sp. UBA7503 TaxID=1946377 RepID=UPI0032177303
MRRRKTKGSSMLLVIAVFGILATLALAMLGATYANYRLRIEENNRVKNLYSAESGIDKAYTRITKVVEIAIEEGIAAGNKETTIKKQNEIFKGVFKDYIDYNLIDYVSGEYVVNSNKAEVKCELKVPAIEKEGLDYKIVKLTSTYKDDKGKERVVSVAYNLVTPESYRILGKTDGNTSKLINYSLAADGNLTIATDSSHVKEGKVEVDGNLWIQGLRSEDMAKAPTVDKYKGGIEINNTDIEFKGQVNTAANITIDKSKVNFKAITLEDKEVDNKVYAENIFLGSLAEGDVDRGIDVDSSKADIYLANDLVIGASDVKINIKNLYGFNDLNIASPTDNGQVVRGSSSIIINSMKWPNNKGNLIVSDSAYLMGSAYIKTHREPYQTGESVALKGNYKAYAKDYNGNYKDSQYEYLDPLVLITKDAQGQPLNVVNKAEHFVDYSNSSDESIRAKGISLPQKTYTAGAYISGGKAHGNSVNLNEKELDEVKHMRESFVQAVYYMENEEFDVNKFQQGKAVYTVENQINWDGVSSLIANRGNIIQLENMVILLNDDENRGIEINDDKLILRHENKEATYNKEFNREESKDITYIVVTKGDVNYNGTKDYKGTIISLKDINIKNSKGLIGTAKLSEAEIKDKKNKGVLDFIFTQGKNLVTERTILATDLITKEKWTLEK